MNEDSLLWGFTAFWFILSLFPDDSDGKESACNAKTRVRSLSRKIPWRRKWLPIPVFLSWKSHGQRNLAGYSSWGAKSWTPVSMHAKSLQSCLTLCDPMDCSPQAPLSMGFSRQEDWNRLTFPSPGDLPDPGIKPTSLVTSALAGKIIYH